MRNLIFLVVLIILFISFPSTRAGADSAPFTIGSSCDVSSPSYKWETLSRSKWSFEIIFALPSDLYNPDEWTSGEVYRQRIVELSAGLNTPSALAQACLAAWPEFNAGSSNLILRFTRQFSITTRIVSCIGSVWSIESEDQSSQTDFSDWIRLGDAPYIHSQTSSDSLSNAMQQKLDELNGQPGAEDMPSDVYTLLQ